MWILVSRIPSSNDSTAFFFISRGNGFQFHWSRILETDDENGLFVCLFVSEESSTTSKEPEQLAFSEDEETLVIRMYNLVGERLVVSLFLCVKNSSGWTWIHDWIRPSISKLNTIQTQTLISLLFRVLFDCLLIRDCMNNCIFRWSLIAGRIPGRTAEEIEKYWNSRYATSRCGSAWNQY